MHSNTCDQVIISITLFLIVFAPLSFGAVQGWALNVIGALVLLALSAWILKLAWLPHPGFASPPFSVAALLFLFLVLLQLIPLPSSWLAFLSPASNAQLETHATPADPSRPLTDSPWLTVTLNPKATRRGFLTWLTGLAFCLTLLNNVLSWEKVRSVLITLIGVGSFEALYGLFEYWSGHQHIFWYKKVYYLREVTGTYINHNHFAGLLVLILPLTIAVFSVECYRHLADGEATFLQKLRNLPGRVYLKLICLLASVGSMSVGIVLSKSRGGLIALVVSLFVLASFFRKGRYRRVIQIACLVALLCGIVTTRFDPGLIDRFHWWSDEAQIRYNLWKDCAKIVRAFPIFGAGLGTFKEIIPRYRSQLDFVNVSDVPQGAFWYHAHNDYLQLLVECGFAGFLTIAWGMLITWRQLLSGLACSEDLEGATIGYGLLSGMIGLLLHSFVDFNFHIPANALLFCVCLSLCLIFARGKGPSSLLTKP